MVKVVLMMIGRHVLLLFLSALIFCYKKVAMLHHVRPVAPLVQMALIVQVV